MSKSRSVLFLFASHPQLSSSAASVRSIGLLRAFEKYGYTAHSATIGKVYANTNTGTNTENRALNNNASTVSKPEESRNVENDRLPNVRQIIPNDTAEMSRLLADTCPHVVVFDRMWVEEMFSHYIYQQTPDAMRILDTQDLHSLRDGRMKIIRSGGTIEESVAHIPYPSSSPMASRELAAIHRSDLTLVCSTHEAQLLKKEYGILPHKVAVAPFISAPEFSSRSTDDLSQDSDCSLPATQLPTNIFLRPINESQQIVNEAQQTTHRSQQAMNGQQQPICGSQNPTRESRPRRHFMTIGRYDHPPNADSLSWLCGSIWPLIRQQLPDAQLHVYGSHFPPNAAHSLTYMCESETRLQAQPCTSGGKGASQSSRMVKVHNIAKGVHVKGYMESLEELSQYKVMLAPLRYGAGIKGKIADGWKWGLPVVTTPIGCEGMGATHLHEHETTNICKSTRAPDQYMAPYPKHVCGRVPTEVHVHDHLAIQTENKQPRVSAPADNIASDVSEEAYTDGHSAQLAAQDLSRGSDNPILSECRAPSTPVVPVLKVLTSRDESEVSVSFDDTTRIKNETVTLDVDAQMCERRFKGTVREKWPGICSPTSAKDFADRAVKLYTDGSMWRDIQQRGRSKHSELFVWEANAKDLLELVVPGLCERLHSNREKDVVQGMIWHHSLATTRHLARYIELKNNDGSTYK
ncbi:hypothetical protein, variant [Sphaeroforma arctica JP610]|uniref:Glycosyltransferase subfamily 4-like N-terminal domain-containing protein n=1 Tax=Sphaeroforma arctica JP610 TaxID=667725 RepID=A0A0L0FYX3_9EUKA|nr:hypothetical protein, variant [Sphaeroforma arctica JP610]KNC81761.1 hypothetical protein, variant [Sphaeroforma arctica JP610]|eukprot:XP_014155663.1 hypothetical protein, variant [Sphaeroforma arctica JP610]